MRRFVLCSAALLLSAAVAHADPPAPDARVDPLLRFEVPTGLPGVPVMHDDRPLGAALTAPGLDDAGRRSLEEAGLTFRRTRSGRFVQVGDQWLVDGTPPVLRRLAQAGWSLRVGRPMDPRMSPTLVTGPEIGSDALIASGSTPVTGLAGQDVAIFDIDSDADPFHPHLFRADGGAWPWVDVDGDRELTPGVDGLDLDGDGELAEHEILQLLESWYWEYDYETGAQEYYGRDGRLDPDGDYLWLDLDGDGERGSGAAAGFTEDDPAYGEPIFVPDDADLDGAMELDERLLRLASSRIRVAFSNGQAWRRGSDLVEYPVVPEQAGHGTGVLGIMSGAPSRHVSRFPGLLPDVDLMVWGYWTGNDSDMLAALAEAEDEGADVVLHEYAWWQYHHLDGSDPVERAIDAQSEDGVVHVCPAGNLGGTGKHAERTPTGGAVEFAFQVPESTEWTTYGWFNLELHSLQQTLSGCTLEGPAGDVLPIEFEGEGASFSDGMKSWGAAWQSGVGNWLYQTYVYPPGDGEGPVTSGRWVMRCSSDGGGLVHGFLGDDITSWSRGVTFEGEEDASTICWPATSDSCIAVGASAGRVPYWSEDEPGQLKGYSSRGPRITGDRTIDVVAPTDPYAPAPYDGNVSWDTWPAEYRTFGGTSGAGPHVAAVAAQLKQAEPEATGVEIRELIRQGAEVDSFVQADGVVDLPDDDWGYGKLRAYDALFASPAPTAPDAPVSVGVTFEGALDGERCRVTALPSAAGHPEAWFRWDWSYDGRWDGDFERGDLTYVIEPGERLTVRVQAAIDGWWIGDGLGVWTVPDECEELGLACTGCAAGGGVGPLSAGLLALVALVRRRRRARTTSPSRTRTA